MAADGHLGDTKISHNFTTALLIDMMFGSSMRFSGSADLMVQLSVTLSDPEPQLQGHSIVQRRISHKRCIRSTPCLVLGKGFRGRRIEWRYFCSIISNIAGDSHLGTAALLE